MMKKGLMILLLLLLSTGALIQAAVAELPQNVLETLVEHIVVQGAAFAPTAVQELVSETLSMVPEELFQHLSIPKPSTGLIVAEKSSLNLVLSNVSGEGYATVEGFLFKRKLYVGEISLNIILAKDISITTMGEYAKISDILSNPEEYELRLVNVIGITSQLPILYDPDEGGDKNILPVLLGCIADSPEVFPSSILRDLMLNARSLTKSLAEAMKSLPEQCLIYLGYNRTGRFIQTTEMMIDGIILLPGSLMTKLLSKIVGPTSLLTLPDKPLMYLVHEEIPQIESVSVQQIKNNPVEYLRKVVELTVNAIGGGISVQETLRKSYGEAPPLDIILDALVAWDENTLTSLDDLLIMVGASNLHQDEVYQRLEGVFRIVGEVVPTFQLDESLASEVQVILVIYQMDYLRGLILEEVSEDVLQTVERKILELNFILTSFLPEIPPEQITLKPPAILFKPSYPVRVRSTSDLPQAIFPGRTIEILIERADPGTPIMINLLGSTISRIYVKLKTPLRNLNLTLSKLDQLPEGIPQPSPQVYAYILIETNIPEHAIGYATIDFWVEKDWIFNSGKEPTDVRLMRYDDEWEVLQTEIIEENVTHVHYSAILPGFSIFAITIYEDTIPKELEIVKVRMSFGYEGKELPADVAKDLEVEVWCEEPHVSEHFVGESSISLTLPRGVYTLEARWKGLVVAREILDLTPTDLKVIDLNIELKLTDAVITVTDLSGRPLVITPEHVAIEGGPYAMVSVKDNKVTVVAMIKHLTYTVTVSYSAYGVITAASYVGPPRDVKLTLPVGDVQITIVDPNGDPIPSVAVTLAGHETITDLWGTAVFQMVPLEDVVGSPITYEVAIARERTIRAMITTSRASTHFTIIYPLGSIMMVVRDEEGVPLPGLMVELYLHGSRIDVQVTDEEGVAMFDKLPLDTYVIRIRYNGILKEAEVSLAEDDIAAGRPVYVEIRLLRESELQKAGEHVQRPIIEERGETFPPSLEILLAWIILIALILVAAIIAIIVIILKVLSRRT